MNKLVETESKFKLVIRTLLKAWAIGLFVPTILFGSTFVVHSIFNDPNIQSFGGKIISAILFFGLFFVSSAIFSLPLLFVAGVAAYFMLEKIALKPLLSTVLATLTGSLLLGFLMFIAGMSGKSLVDSLLHSTTSLEAVVFHFAFACSAVFFSYSVRKKLLLKDVLS